MRRWWTGAALAGALAMPALAQPMQGGAPMHMPTTRTEAQAAMRAQFARLDGNGDGVITRDEFDAFRATMHAAAPGAEAPAAMPHEHGGMGGMGGIGGKWFDRADADGDGRVTPAEADKAAMTLFDMIDTDHDGTISADERETARQMMQMMHHGGVGQ